MELSIDTSTRYASVALSTKGQVAEQVVWRSEQNHSVELVPTLRRMMERARVTMEDVEAIFVARGPGGFSALRVGVSVAKAMAMAQGVPLVGVGTLDVEAQPYVGVGRPVCAIMEAGRGKVYLAEYHGHPRPRVGPGGEYSVVSHEELASRVGTNTLVCGEAASSLADMLREVGGNSAEIIDSPPPTRRPEALAELAYERLTASDTDDPESLTPLYIRGSQYEVARRSHGLGV